MADCRLHDCPESGNSNKLALMLTLCRQAFAPAWHRAPRADHDDRAPPSG